MTASPTIAVSLVVLAGISVVLGVLILRRFWPNRRFCHLYWGAGLFLSGVTLLQEAAFYLGAWSQLFVQTYFILVALLVGVLSLGSAELSLPTRWKRVWFGYIAAASLALVIVGYLYAVPTSVVVAGVLSGMPATPVIIVSSLVTFPGAALLIASSLYGVVRDRRLYLLFITAGAIVFSVAGSLYLVSFPVSMYYAEFLGTALLFLGFVRVPGLSARLSQPAST